jgi:hypothetical protein
VDWYPTFVPEPELGGSTARENGPYIEKETPRSTSEAKVRVAASVEERSTVLKTSVRGP